MASSRAQKQRDLLRASEVLHRVLARQRLPHRSERFLIHQPHRTPARGVLRATTAVMRPFARTRVPRIAGVQRAVRATDDVDEVHAPIVGSARGYPEMPDIDRSVPVRQVPLNGDVGTDANPPGSETSLSLPRLKARDSARRVG